MKTFVGAKACVPINQQIRSARIIGICAQAIILTITLTSRRVRDEDSQKKNYTDEDILARQPVSAVHVDINRERATRRALDAFGEDTTFSENDRVAIM